MKGNNWRYPRARAFFWYVVLVTFVTLMYWLSSNAPEGDDLRSWFSFVLGIAFGVLAFIRLLEDL